MLGLPSGLGSPFLVSLKLSYYDSWRVCVIIMPSVSTRYQLYQAFRFGVFLCDELFESEIYAKWYLVHFFKSVKLIFLDDFSIPGVVVEGAVRSYVPLCVTLPANEYSLNCASRVLIASSSTSQWPVYPPWVLVWEFSSCNGSYPPSIVTLHYF
eukprot:IDg17116t1